MPYMYKTTKGIAAFEIPLIPVTKKNSQRIVMRGKWPRILPSKQYVDYEKKAIPFCPVLGIDTPVNIEAIYYMSRRDKVDITNLESALMDVLVKAGTIVDDNCSIVVSTDGSRVRYDKSNPRTVVRITASDEVEPEFVKNK